MSANIKYKIVKPEGKDLGVFAPSSFIETLERAFGRFPVEIGPEDVPTLKGIHAALGGGHDGEAVQTLIEQCEQNRIRVWAEY